MKLTFESQSDGIEGVSCTRSIYLCTCSLLLQIILFFPFLSHWFTKLSTAIQFTMHFWNLIFLQNVSIEKTQKCMLTWLMVRWVNTYAKVLWAVCLRCVYFYFCWVGFHKWKCNLNMFLLLKELPDCVSANSVRSCSAATCKAVLSFTSPWIP